jgi:PiT family inorganic phosphate transporter
LKNLLLSADEVAEACRQRFQGHRHSPCQVGSSAGFAMVSALLIAAILWNLGTWYLGLPASSSHTMIGSIIGVGVADALMRGRGGVDWGKATEIGEALLFSPIVGFILSAVLLMMMKLVTRSPNSTPPPRAIRRRCGGSRL